MEQPPSQLFAELILFAVSGEEPQVPVASRKSGTFTQGVDETGLTDMLQDTCTKSA